MTAKKNVLASMIISLIIGVILVTTIYSGIEYFAQNWNCLWD